MFLFLELLNHLIGKTSDTAQIIVIATSELTDLTESRYIMKAVFDDRYSRRIEKTLVISRILIRYFHNFIGMT